MRTFLALVIFLALFSACDSTTKQTTSDMIVNGLVNAVVTSLDCTGKDAIKASVEPVVTKIFSAPKVESSVSGSVCKAVVASAIPEIIGDVLPAEWNCSGEKLANFSEKLAEKACDKL